MKHLLHEFQVKAKIVGKGRPRAFMGNKKGGGKTIRMFTPKETVQTENYIAFVFLSTRKVVNAPLFEGPLRIEIDCFHEVPKSYSKKDTKLAHSGWMRPTKKPDADNILKLVSDGLNEKAYQDDVQLVEKEIRKFYVTNDQEQEHMVIRIYSLKPDGEPPV